jgi:hypothetical protein
MSTVENTDNYKMVILHLKNGENLIGPAIVHRPVGKSVDIEEWIYTDFVLMNKPLRAVVDLSTERCVLGLFKYNVLTDDQYSMIKTDCIQSISYLNEQNILLYNSAVKYFDNIILPRFNKEVDAYINQLSISLKKNESVKPKETNEFDLDTIMKFIPVSNTTIH